MKPTAPKLRLVRGPAMRRRVDFFNNATDQTIMTAALLGWKIKDIAAYAGVSPSQAYYRLHTLLRISVMEYRGANGLSQSILRQVRDSRLMESAKTGLLRAADITPALDTRIRKVLG